MRSMIKATNNTRRMLQINKLLFKPNFSLLLWNIYCLLITIFPIFILKTILDNDIVILRFFVICKLIIIITLITYN